LSIFRFLLLKNARAWADKDQNFENVISPSKALSGARLFGQIGPTLLSQDINN
jgi:hypothetical protein